MDGKESVLRLANGAEMTSETLKKFPDLQVLPSKDFEIIFKSKLMAKQANKIDIVNEYMASNLYKYSLDLLWIGKINEYDVNINYSERIPLFITKSMDTWENYPTEGIYFFNFEEILKKIKVPKKILAEVKLEIIKLLDKDDIKSIKMNSDFIPGFIKKMLIFT